MVENLPGYPDTVTSAGARVFRVTLYGPRPAPKDRAMSTPWLRKVAACIPPTPPHPADRSNSRMNPTSASTASRPVAL